MKKDDKKCICEECPRRFICFTNKKVFSDPRYQALYEAYCEEGMSHEDAVKEVKETIERSLRPKPPISPWKKPDKDEWHLDDYQWNEWYSTHAETEKKMRELRDDLQKILYVKKYGDRK